jgi:hypothetical protein
MPVNTSTANVNKASFADGICLTGTPPARSFRNRA